MSKIIDKAGSVFLRSVLVRMKELGLNKTSLAERMNASRPYVTKVLNGDVSVTLRTASRFAKALQMDFVPMLTPKVEEVAPPAFQGFGRERCFTSFWMKSSMLRLTGRCGMMAESAMFKSR